MTVTHSLKSMWSDRYYYLNIYRDDKLSEDFNTANLVTFLTSLPELMQVNGFSFKNVDSFPFLDIQILKARTLDSWSDQDTDNDATNLITILCAKGDKNDFERIKLLLIKIASFMNWSLTDEHTDDGEENKSIWTPLKIK